MKDLFERVKKCSQKEKGSNIDILSYIMEEVGEVATCLAVEKGLKNRDLDESTPEECVDVIISTLGLLVRYNMDYDTFSQYLSKKLNKWEARVERLLKE